MSKVEELLNELILKKEKEEQKNKTWIIVLAVIGGVVAVAGIAYALYRFFAPDYLDDFEDDFDDFEDDFFDEEDEVEAEV